MVQLLVPSSSVKLLPNHRLACLNSGGKNKQTKNQKSYKHMHLSKNKPKNLMPSCTGKCIKDIVHSFYIFSNKNNIVKAKLFQRKICRDHWYYWGKKTSSRQMRTYFSVAHLKLMLNELNACILLLLLISFPENQ